MSVLIQRDMVVDSLYESGRDYRTVTLRAKGLAGITNKVTFEPTKEQFDNIRTGQKIRVTIEVEP